MIVFFASSMGVFQRKGRVADVAVGWVGGMVRSSASWWLTRLFTQLWSLIQLNRWLRKNKMRSKIVGQIHDSIVADVHEDELEDYLAQAKQIMTQDLLKKWKWIIVPLDVEAEVTPVDGTWYEKKEREIGTL